jgi:predicted DNA-binding protein YlxM (UPF0122 family)
MDKTEDEIIILDEWLDMDKAFFRLLTVISVLADNNLAFRGTIKELCQEIGIQPSPRNKENVAKVITHLEKNEYAKVIHDEGVYTISLAAAAEKSSNVKKIKKAWYQLIKDTDSEAAWESILKVFVFLLSTPQDLYLSQTDIADSLNISKSTVGRCIRTIKTLKFPYEPSSLVLKTDELKQKSENGVVRSFGTKYEFVMDFT